MGPLELATTSFGQGVSVTPLQQLMAVSAMANGGYLKKPYLVKEIRNDQGEVVYEGREETVRQVISADTSRRVAAIMESVVENGSGTNAAIEGYRIGAKTGTAQKVGPGGTCIPGEYILSLIGFVPVDDPQIILYVAVDGATRGPQWGSQVCAPIFRRIMNDVLAYLKIPPQEGPALPEGRWVSVPDLKGLTVDQAAEAVDTEGLLLRIVGEGNYIVNQTPKAGAQVPAQTQVVIYLHDGEGVPEKIQVPDLRGLTVKEAGEVLSWLGLHLKVEGSGIAVKQSPDPGTEVVSGAAVAVTFSSSLQQ